MSTRMTINLLKMCAFAALAVLLICQAVSAQQPLTIVGTWRVVAFETHNSDGTVTKPYGEQPIGYFIYDSTGHLSIQVMENPAKSDPPTAFGYFGTYKVDYAKHIVIHHVEGATDVNHRSYIGKDEPRPFRLDGDHLIIKVARGDNSGIPVPPGVEYVLREMVRVR
jgi:hypothetical protein